MASARETAGSSAEITISLSGVIVSPAANIKISCRDAATGKMIFNASGNSKDSTLNVLRIQ
jgi:hypothetical protein